MVVGVLQRSDSSHFGHGLCDLKEVPVISAENRGYTMLQSVPNEKWYVGFNKKGKTKKGDAYYRWSERARRWQRHGRKRKPRRASKCFQFLLLPDLTHPHRHHAHTHSRQSPGGDPHLDFSAYQNTGKLVTKDTLQGFDLEALLEGQHQKR